MKTIIKTTAVMITILAAFACQQSTEKAIDKSVPDSLAGTFWDYTLPVDERVDDLISKLTLEEKCAQMLHDAPAIPRLNIPAYNWWNEALHGVARFGRATVFPQPIGMAATFDEKLIKRIGTAISDEARAKFNAAQKIENYAQYCGLTFWSPNVNLFRDARWGRGMETWGEDPFLTGTLGSAFVKGLQGNNEKYLKAAACAKHYVVHSGPEGLRHHFNAIPPIKDFYESYLPPFEMLVKDANVEAVMCAYNRTFDEPCCGSPFLLKEILKDKWGFEGHILSDCWAINDFHENHQVTNTPEESVAQAIKAGVNLNCGNAFEYLEQAIEQGLVTEQEIDENLAVLLRTRFKLGLFDPANLNPYNKINTDVVNCKAHKALAKEAAAKSIVMLKNNGVLPLEKTTKYLFVIGPNAANVDVLLGNYHGVSDDMTTILEGITSKVDPGTRLEYRHGFLLDRENINKIGWAISEATDADVTIAVMGLNTLLEGEEGEAIASPFKSDRKDIKLPGKQLEYFKQLRDNDGKPLIVILTGGSPIAIPEIHELADAVLFAWYPGEQGGMAVADILFGDAAPSGKLPLTFPYSVDQLPDYENYSMQGRTYKYMDDEPLYPFGFGLSYTSFDYSKLQVNQDGEKITLSANVKNTGAFESEEVVQLYATTKDADFDVPMYDLKGFKRVMLKPGESKTVTFELTKNKMENIDNKGNSVFVKGEYTFYLGGSLPSQRSIDLGAQKPVSININLK